MRKLLRAITVLLLTWSWGVVYAQAQESAFANKGVNLYVHTYDYKDPYDLYEKLQAVDGYLRTLGVNSLSLVWPIFVDGVRGNKVYATERTPSLEDLQQMIQYLRFAGYHITLRPTIDEINITAEDPQEWRGTLRPRSVQAWFASYEALLGTYVDMAQLTGVEVFTIGVELSSLERHQTQWSNLIAAFRGRYSGELTYASNRGVSAHMPWHELDFISVDAFYELMVEHDASVADMVDAYHGYQIEIEQAKEKYKMPVVFAEIGTTSQRGSFRRPWQWNHRTPVDHAAQARFFTASCEVWRDSLVGLYWWKMRLVPPEDPQTDRGFYFQGKSLVEEAVTHCFSS